MLLPHYRSPLSKGFRLRARVMYHDTNEPDRVSTGAAIEQDNNQLAGIREIESVRQVDANSSGEISSNVMIHTPFAME